MDEVFGYFPPTANPPSKTPMLTLLKQARAFGLGVVLATQNPVDLDYKGLSNAGTWFLGRLQTERDKARVLEGLEGASATPAASSTGQQWTRPSPALGSRVFLLNNVHEDAPVVFQTRWVLSYLRGPLTREQIRDLMDPRKQAAREGSEGTPAGAKEAASDPLRSTLTGPFGTETTDAATGQVVGSAAAAASGYDAPGAGEAWEMEADDGMQGTAATPSADGRGSARRAGAAGAGTAAPSGGERPVLPAGVPELFWPTPPVGGTYAPLLVGTARLHFVQSKNGIDLWDRLALASPLTPPLPSNPWDHATALARSPALPDPAEPWPQLVATPPQPAATPRAGAVRRAPRGSPPRHELLRLEPQALLLPLPREGDDPDSAAASSNSPQVPGRARPTSAPAPPWPPGRSRTSRRTSSGRSTRSGPPPSPTGSAAPGNGSTGKDQAQQQKLQTTISVGAALLGAFLGGGRTRSIGRATTAARGAGRIARERGDVERATAEVQELEEQLRSLEEEFAAELRQFQKETGGEIRVETLAVRPRKSDIEIGRVVLVWVPGELAAVLLHRGT